MGVEGDNSVDIVFSTTTSGLFSFFSCSEILICSSSN